MQDIFNNTIGWLLGLEDVRSINHIDRLTLASPWAAENPFWVFAALVALAVLVGLFYLRWQPRGSFARRGALALSRALLLALLVLTLADPVVQLTITNTPKPLLYVLFDGTDSMAIADELPEEERRELARAVGLADSASQPLTRVAYVQALLRNKEAGGREADWLARLQREKGVQLECFVFDGTTTSQLRKLDFAGDGRGPIDGAQLAEQLTTHGQVTALGAVLNELTRQYTRGNLAGVVLFSDFAHNSGDAPLGSPGMEEGASGSPAARLRELGVPLYTVGVGATQTLDLAVDLQTDPKMKKAEKTSIAVRLTQTGLEGRQAHVRVFARPRTGSGLDAAEVLVGERTVPLENPTHSLDFPFTPQESGRFEFHAEVEPLEGEVVDQNNRAAREVNIIDDYLRLMFVEYEPTWEWRFVKEVFHRDKLVGTEGFRTFLASSDPRVRETNVLFLSTLTPKRSDFFANDVIFLGDLPSSALSPRFCDMLQEFVRDFGGGLVVMAGPRFGPGQLAGTPLADMLPVVLDPDARFRDDRPFVLEHTAEAAAYDFMRLGDTEAEDLKAWRNLGPLPWYQPVQRLERKSTALAVHPHDRTVDGESPQPIIAVRQYGAGEVVYLGFNETWRLRRRYGEKYYRRFWSQLIYRLGMSHALGSEKRFVVETDRQRYRAEDDVLLTIEAYDANFEPLTREQMAEGELLAELVAPGLAGGAPQSRMYPVSLLKPGQFQSKIKVYNPGDYLLRVKDPVTGRQSEVRFEVASTSAERRRATRDEELQRELARQTRGKSYDLKTVGNLPQELEVVRRSETLTRNHALWSTPLWFGLVVLLMLGEWLGRKLLRLT